MTMNTSPKCFPGIRELHAGIPCDEAPILAMCEDVNWRFDCADFRMVSLIRAIYSYERLLSAQASETIRRTILNFKYWMDEPGEDSMCYWSENHQVLFAAVEYLAGQRYPDERFSNANLIGREHLEKARIRLMNWLKDRFDYGFTEWHSNTYYEEDIAALSILIDFCEDEEIVLKAKMIMDLLLLDMGMHSFQGLFAATSGRCYEAQKKRPRLQNIRDISESVWGFGHVSDFDYSRISANFLLMERYDLPEAIRLIGRDSEDRVIKDSMGLDLSELATAFPDSKDMERRGLFLWAMESFTNPESVVITLRMFNRWRLHGNAFLADLRLVDHALPRKLGLLPLVIRLLNPVTQGFAIQRANSYTYKTKHYMLSTAQAYHPGEFAHQQHVWQATLSPEITVFTTHPGASAFEDDQRNASPGYWVGSGILPHAVQDRHVHISIYRLDGRKGFMEKKRARFTHAYFPQERFDEVVRDGRYLFGRAGDAYIALIGRYELETNPDDASDLIQKGLETYWICELGSREAYGDFGTFVETIRARTIRFHRHTLTYQGEREYSLTYKGAFRIDGVMIETNYDRIDTPYGKVARNPREIEISFGGQYLYLNFESSERRHGGIKR
ncbi:hypothetical protein [Paenibacillus sp. HB172176]|uniref:hypothetical protein n=1 Tax=Paenibacillus sp. HB172176 TaxID=2493690 RepID=UPI00143B8D18|nr:hypothetical protein [Paenibacillus sp. HB172176]